MGCAMSTGKRRRRQAKMIRGRKATKFDFRAAANSKKRAS